MDFKRLDALMLQKGISNIRMGIATETTDAMVGRWRKGEADPKADKLGRIADVLECSADYLLGRCDSMQVAVAPALPDDEEELLSYYRGLSTKGKRHVLNYAENEADSESERGKGATLA